MGLNFRSDLVSFWHTLTAVEVVRVLLDLQAIPEANFPSPGVWTNA